MDTKLSSSLPAYIAHYDWENVRLKLRDAPDAAKQVDAFGLLPLHRACEMGAAPLDILQELITAYPESIHITTAYGSQTPLDIAQTSYSKTSDAVNYDQVMNLLQKNAAVPSEEEEDKPKLTTQEMYLKFVVEASNKIVANVASEGLGDMMGGMCGNILAAR